MAIWSNTDKRIQLHNQRFEIGQETYVREHNKFSDMTTEEKRTFLGSLNEKGKKRSIMHMIKQKATTKKATTTTKTTTTKKPTTTTTKKTTTTKPTTTKTTTTKPTTISISNSTGVDWRAKTG